MPIPHTHLSRPPARPVGTMKPKLSLSYAMARPSLWNLSTFDNKSTTARVVARVFGARLAVAGLDIL